MSHLLRRYQDARTQDYDTSLTVTEILVKTFNKFMLGGYLLATMEAVDITMAGAQYATSSSITIEELTAMFKYVSETVNSFPNIVDDIYLLMIPKDLEDDGTYSSVLFVMIERSIFHDHMNTKYNLTPDDIGSSQACHFNSLDTALDHLDDFMIESNNVQRLSKPISIAHTKRGYSSAKEFITVPLSECINRFKTIDISLVKSYYESK